MPEQDQNTIVAPIVSKAQSISSTLNRNIEIFSLTPSTLLTLWEIDASVIMDETGIRNINDKAIFRFHNSVKLMNTTIKWNGQDYIAVPIQAQGFEYTAKGSPPTPKLTLAVNDEGAPMLSLLKSRIRELNDLTGVRVTRRRVFAKYIDGENFETISQEDLAGKGFAPDPNMKFEPDIYFIDRKSIENKSVIEFELGSILDIEGIKIPGRIVAAKRCPFAYRGNGCLYEYNANRVTFIHGESTESTLPDEAPPVATFQDELISEILGGSTPITYVGKYNKDTNYVKGNAVYVQKDGIKYYFVAKSNSPPAGPPNPIFWVSDSCSKLISGCRFRFKNAASLNFGGFPSTLTAV